MAERRQAKLDRQARIEAMRAREHTRKRRVRLASPSDPRLQQFIDKFRVSQQYTPEYGAPCTGGVGTPLQQ